MQQRHRLQQIWGEKDPGALSLQWNRVHLQQWTMCWSRKVILVGMDRISGCRISSIQPDPSIFQLSGIQLNTRYQTPDTSYLAFGRIQPFFNYPVSGIWLDTGYQTLDTRYPANQIFINNFFFYIWKCFNSCVTLSNTRSYFVIYSTEISSIRPDIQYPALTRYPESSF